jgi:hypothetical protein
MQRLTICLIFLMMILGIALCVDTTLNREVPTYAITKGEIEEGRVTCPICGKDHSLSIVHRPDAIQKRK